MASLFSLQLSKSFFVRKSLGSRSKRRADTDVRKLSKSNGTICAKRCKSLGFLFTPSRVCCVSPRESTPVASSASSEETLVEVGSIFEEKADELVDFNRINCLVWVLHESAKSFSHAVESLGLAGSGAELAMAWNGKDVHKWHRNIAYHVAAYALLNTVIEVETLLSHDRPNNSLPVRECLIPKVNLLGEYIEGQLSMKNPELVQWFRVIEFPRVAGFFTPLLKKWSIDYAGSGVAGIVVAISCCTAIEKLGPGRVYSSSINFTVADVLVDLMDLSHDLVELEKLHKLAMEAGFEANFLSHFGAKVVPCSKTEELEFWIGLAQKKLSVVLYEEMMISDIQAPSQKLCADSLATFGLFTYLGRKTRLFLSRMGINDLDEMVKDFLSYLECGILFVYPGLASVSKYECFMEVVTDEIGWLDFYAAYSYLSFCERKRSKQHAIQAEKEIFLSTILTVCYDVFSGFAHFTRSTVQPLESELLSFLLRSQSLLTVCMEDYWAVYDRSRDPLKFSEMVGSDQTLPAGLMATNKLSVATEAQRTQPDLLLKSCLNNVETENLEKVSSSAEIESIPSASTSKPTALHRSLIKKYGPKLVATSTDIWMGTQLLFVDMKVSLRIILKQWNGERVTKRERKKLNKTLNDIATLVPITILMLLPVSAVGHAAMLAAINKYMPSLIPSQYCSDRLDVVKQLKRTKKMEIRSWSNLEDPSSKTNIEYSSSRTNLEDPSSIINIEDPCPTRLNIDDPSSRKNPEDSSSRVNLEDPSTIIDLEDSSPSEPPTKLH